MKQLAIALVAAAVLIIAAIKITPIVIRLFASGHSENPHDGMRAIRERKGSKEAIVFVHGINGDADGTWTNPDTMAYFPKLLLDDPVFDRFDIYVFEYATGYVTKTSRIDEVGENLRLRVQTDALKDKQLVFVAHSMGGNVVRSCLLNSHDIAARTPLIVFYGTPSNGSDLANYLKVISDNPQASQLATNGDTWIQSQQIAWINAGFKTRSYAAFETVPTHGVIVVDQGSALLLATHADPISRNHTDLVKPANREDTSYIVLKSAIRSVIPEDLCNCGKDYPDGDAKDQMDHDSRTEAMIMKSNNGQPAEITPPDENALSIKNDSGIEVTLLVYDCTNKFVADPGDMPWRCKTLANKGVANGKLFSEFRKPTGWFMFFRRYVNVEAGKVKDQYLGTFDVYDPKYRRLVLGNGPTENSIVMVTDE